MAMVITVMDLILVFQKYGYQMKCFVHLVKFYNLKNVKNTHGGVLFLVNCTKSNNPTWIFFTFFQLYKWYQIAQSITYK